MAVPAVTPVTTPFASTVAVEVLLLVHVPPASPLLIKAIVVPRQTEEAPLMVPALAFGETVTASVAVAVPQELVTLYEMVALPGFTPVTTPVFAFTLATLVLSLLHVPPASPVDDSVIVSPSHIDDFPLMVPA